MKNKQNDIPISMFWYESLKLWHNSLKKNLNQGKMREGKREGRIKEGRKKEKNKEEWKKEMIAI